MQVESTDTKNTDYRTFLETLMSWRESQLDREGTAGSKYLSKA